MSLILFQKISLLILLVLNNNSSSVVIFIRGDTNNNYDSNSNIHDSTTIDSSATTDSRTLNSDNNAVVQDEIHNLRRRIEIRSNDVSAATTRRRAIQDAARHSRQRIFNIRGLPRPYLMRNKKRTMPRLKGSRNSRTGDGTKTIINNNHTCPYIEPMDRGVCVEKCNSNNVYDRKCTSHNKLCCSNGCGHVCMDPVIVDNKRDDNDVNNTQQQTNDFEKNDTTTVCEIYKPNSNCWSEESYNQCKTLEDKGNCVGTEIIMTRSCPPIYSCRKTMFVGSTKADRDDEGRSQVCYLVRFDKSDNNEWELFCYEIDGFQWKEGYEYELIVSVVANRREQTSINYVLLQEVNRERKQITSFDNGEDCPISGFGIKYVANSAAECSRIRFTCDVGLEPFFGPNDCGCGCRSLTCGGDVKCPFGSICIDDLNNNGGSICRPGKTINMFIYPTKVNCEGMVRQSCYLVKFDNSAGTWQYFYDNIIDFDGIWEEGHEYEILVRVLPIENPPADSSSIQYLLMDVIRKSDSKMYMPEKLDGTESITPSSVCDPPTEVNTCINKQNHEYCLTLEVNGCTSKEIQIAEICPLKYTCSKTLYVASEMIDCVSAQYSTTKRQCYLIKFNEGDEEWQFTYNDIVGFQWKQGYEYKLIVDVGVIQNPEAPGQSSIIYRLLQEVDRKRLIIVDENCPDGLGVKYVANSAEECSSILFKCDVGEEAFFGPDDCGCGCMSLLFCGGITGAECPVEMVCFDFLDDSCDPSTSNDCVGICRPGKFCGGIAGIKCPVGSICIDDPNDSCDPNNGGADCSGICQPEKDNRRLMVEQF